MISPQMTFLNSGTAGAGQPGPAGAGLPGVGAGGDPGSGETTPEPADGAAFAPWVALALGTGTQLTLPPTLSPGTAGEPAQTTAPPGEESAVLPPGGSWLPLAVAGLPLVTQTATETGGRQPAPSVGGEPDAGPALAATLTLDAADDSQQWTRRDDSIDIDKMHIELAKHLPDVAVLRRQGPAPTLPGDGSVPGSAWHATLGEARPAAPQTTPGTVPLPDTQQMPATPANQASFDQAVAHRMVWMLRNGHQDAQLKVHPEHLGSIDIKLKLDGDDAHLSLTAANHIVRDALETAVPRLRELMNGAGFNLLQVSVDTGQRGQTGAFANGPTSAGAQSADADADTAQTPDVTAVAIRTPTGIVDTFA